MMAVRQDLQTDTPAPSLTNTWLTFARRMSARTPSNIRCSRGK
jgi:hypothetical protein